MKAKLTQDVTMTVSQLYEIVAPQNDYGKRNSEMPEDVRLFGKQLKQIAPVMRTMNYEIEVSTYHKTDGAFARGNKIVKITKVPEE